MTVLVSILPFLLFVSTLAGIICPWECMRKGQQKRSEAIHVSLCHQRAQDQSTPFSEENPCGKSCHENSIFVRAKFKLHVLLLAADLVIISCIPPDFARLNFAPVLKEFSPPPTRSLILRI